MNTFLSKISKLSAVQDVILLSTRGEPLFVSQKSGTEGDRAKSFSHWNEILTALNQPQATEFVFNKGSYYVTRTDIGYVIIGLTDDKILQKIKQACATLLTKLSKPTLRKRVLLNLLSNSNDNLKPNIIKELISYADKEVAAVLIFLLRKENKFASEIRGKLLLLICQVLGHCSSYEAVGELNEFLEKRKTEGNPPDNGFVEAVKISIEQLKQSKTKEAKRKKPVREPTNSKQKKTPESTLPGERQINELLAQKKTDEVLTFITQLIDKCSQKKQFRAAYKLRDWLIEINPMALTEIIHTAELIEEAKQAAIDTIHLETWKKLTDILSIEEFSSLYHAMTLKTYPRGKTIVQQGTNARTLLFINSGQLQTQVLNRDTLVPLNVKEAGEIVGAETFFEASVWTITAKSLGCEMFLLSRAKLESLKKHHPSLEAKLSDFCSSFQSTSTQLQKNKKNRRLFRRRDLSGRMTFAVLNKSGREISNEAKGNLLDISVGGVAFSIHSSQKKNAVTLFGRQLRVSINTGVASHILIRKGTVQAVRDMDLIGNEYSLHLEFSKQLTNSELQQILGSHRSEP
jgi:CRP-like cAMP-binding protein